MWSGINNIMKASLSQQLAQWNWITGADASCFEGTGRPYAASTVVSYHADLEQFIWIEIRQSIDEYCKPSLMNWVRIYLYT